MTIFETIAVLITLAAIASYLNHRFVRLPSTIGLMVIALLMSLGFVVLGKLGLVELRHSVSFIRSIDFSETLLHGMLAFLLFAGALHVDLTELATQKLPVAVLSTVGVVIATFVTGWLFWFGMHSLGFEMPFMYALLFGALISPTDPIAVLGILKSAGAPKSLEIKITGESLFNDGIGVVVFLTILAILVSGHEPPASEVAMFLLEEAVGGVGLGLILGWVVFRLLRSVDNYQVEVLLTLALAAGGYTLAEAIAVSAPIAIVVAGLVIGNQGRAFAMSQKTREHLDTFWELIDEILNAVLFVLMGLEVLALTLNWKMMEAGLIAIVVVLIARFVSVALPMQIMRLYRPFTRGAVRILTWGGLRGGISIALALSLPPSPYRDLILSVTYVVVVFSVLVQGLTLGHLIRGVKRKDGA
ncbi:cation:proton antiporter [Sulfuriferula nivalis]|uniref:Na(+)/H(+) antiporter NhaP n=1 Tax=Sulfuriferula nivalis TaxID=2675298 RepID=A0A809RIW8_9PROT|nr:sodium:proton antiporter [Sulfuriferula nivalis]BBP01445.1 Na(+)/H(+) antiporter NhaP [Sulfuriferula nivalis]